MSADAPNPTAFDLALDTSFRGGTFAIRAEQVRYEGGLDGERQHASDLLQRIGTSLKTLGLEPAGLRTTVVGLGPGSFTGLRVGVATALGLARGSGGALMGIPSVQVQAAQMLAADQRVLAVSDARGGRFTLAGYERDGAGCLNCWLPPRAEKLDPWRASVLSALGEAPCGLLADDSSREQLGPDVPATLVDAPRAPEATLLLELGLERLATEGPDDPDNVRPLYLFPFEAKPRRR